MKKILITSALPYINGIKHLGNLIGSQLPADVYARYMRARGNKVLFICATDEHGTPAELAAIEKKETVEKFCEKMWNIQKNIADGFSISFDYFGRSSSQQNHELTQHFATKLWENGFIEEVNENQFFSKEDNRYLPDRYITGTCPSCGYEKARGDQCENCTKQLQPTDLIDPSSTISGSRSLEIRKTKHLYLKQSELKNKLDDWISKKDDWPILTKSIAKKWLHNKEGLKDRGITRDLSWGVKVKKNGEAWKDFENKVFYVWFDAPIAYIAATKEWSENNSNKEWKKWWITDQGADEVYYVQFMAKDNIPFHTLSFPATIFGSGENWKLVDYIKGFNWLLYEGGKFSTSEKRGIFMDVALKIFPADYWRWWLLSNAPENSDTNFTWDSFQNTINKDLADVLGNFITRVTKFSLAKFGSKIPKCNDYGVLETKTINEIELLYEKYNNFLTKIEIRKASQELRNMWVVGNEYLQKAQPWSILKKDETKAKMIIRFSFHLINLYSLISEPFIPDSCEKIRKNFGLQKKTEWPERLGKIFDNLTDENEMHSPNILFPKITDSEKEGFKEKFSGS